MASDAESDRRYGRGSATPEKVSIINTDDRDKTSSKTFIALISPFKGKKYPTLIEAELPTIR
jgi:hypothetical protein